MFTTRHSICFCTIAINEIVERIDSHEKNSFFVVNILKIKDVDEKYRTVNVLFPNFSLLSLLKLSTK